MGDVRKGGTEKRKKELALPMPPNSQQAKDLRAAYDKELAERAAAEKKRKEERRIERLKRRKKNLETRLEWTKKTLEEVKKELAGD